MPGTAGTLGDARHLPTFSNDNHERARARIRDGAFYGPPRYRNEIEQLTRERTQAEADAERRRDLGQPLAGIDRKPVSLLESQDQPDLVERKHGQIDAGNEPGRADDPVLLRERLHEPLADRAA